MIKFWNTLSSDVIVVSVGGVNVVSVGGVNVVSVGAVIVVSVVHAVMASRKEPPESHFHHALFDIQP